MSNAWPTVEPTVEPSGTPRPDAATVAGTTTGQLPEPQVPGPWLQACSRRFRDHPHLMDLALAAGIYLFTVLALVAGPPFGDAVTPPAWSYVVAAITCGSLVFRRSHPWIVLVVTAAGYLAVQFFSSDVPPLILAVVTALATVTLAGQRRWAILAAVMIMVTALAIGWITHGEDWSHPRPVAIAALCALAIALADATRNRRAYVAAIEERARRAEASREQDALRRVADERLRIARDLHDVLAHHIAVINVQAGVAGHLMDQRPAQARAALDHVRAAARSVLAEMQAVLTVLRDPGEVAEPAEPAPGIGRLDELLEKFRALGLSIDLVVSGVPTPVPAAVDLVAYRVIQESLTNVRKHAGRAAAEVRLDHRPSALVISVTNVGGGGPVRHPAGVPAGTPARVRTAPVDGGFGLIGMRERVHSVGGDLRATPTPDGGFLVTAWLPFTR
jgi:signal transduction histidine kinase